MLTPLSPIGEEKGKKVYVSVFWWKKKKGKKLRPPIQCPCYFSGKTMLVVVRVFHVIDNYDCFFPSPIYGIFVWEIRKVIIGFFSCLDDNLGISCLLL